jgi:hypothetical protein
VCLTNSSHTYIIQFTTKKDIWMQQLVNVSQQRVVRIRQVVGHSCQAVASLDDWTLPGRPYLQALVHIPVLVHISIQ